MAIDLKRLDPAFPVETMGVVGDDDNARFLLAQCDAFGVEREGLVSLPGGATMSVDAFNVLSTGRRTHFYHQGVAALDEPRAFRFFAFARALPASRPSRRPCSHGRALARRSQRLGRDAARGARSAGLATNLELMSTSRDKLAALARPCLPHLDMLIVNDFEIGAVADVETRDASGANAKAIARAVDAALSLGAMRLVVAHFPEGAIAATREGGRFALGSVAMPEDAIAGVNGAGDAFAAGMLYGLHEGWPIEDGLRLGHACAAASMRAVSTTAGVAPVAECLALAEKWGLRPAPA